MAHLNAEKYITRHPRTAPVPRRTMLRLVGGASLLALAPSLCGGQRRSPSARPPRNAKRPNIIYMHSHDTGRYIEPYGYNISTPHLHRFADEGMVFRQAFSASPTCSPSRAALLTGMTPGCNGMWGLAHRGHKLNDYSQTLVQTLSRAGYSTTLSGVQHITAGTPEACAATIGYGTLLQTRSLRAEGVAAAAVRFLERPPSQSFFLDVGFGETHLHKKSKRSRFGYGSGDARTAFVPTCLADTAETRRDMADYEVAAGVLDDGMGRVLGALERNGLADTTLVIITTDHGIPLPGMKSNHTDGGLGVMLMMRGPGGFSGGKVSNALVSQIDIFPTLCELLKLTPPDWLQGVSLMPLVRGEAGAVNEAVFAEYQTHAVAEPQAAVRTERYKYIRRLDGSSHVRQANTDQTFTKELWLREGWAARPVASEQLYDLHADPEERHDLGGDPAYQGVLAEMRGRMIARMERYDNPLLRKYEVDTGPPKIVKSTGFRGAPIGSGGVSREISVVFTE